MRLLVWLPIVVLAGAAAPLPPAVDDAKSLQGTWMVVSLEAKDKKASAEEIKAMSLEIKDTTLTLSDGKRPEKGTFKLDQTKKPKTLDLTIAPGEASEAVLFIYELNGDDLKLCWRKPGGQRPTTFTVEGSDGYMVLKRKK